MLVVENDNLIEMADEPQEREDQYSTRNQDLGIIRRSVDRLSANVGDLVVALKGNDFGSEGLIARVKVIEDEQAAMRDNVKEILRHQKSREKLLLAIYTLGGILLSTLARALFEYFTKASKP